MLRNFFDKLAWLANITDDSFEGLQGSTRLIDSVCFAVRSVLKENDLFIYLFIMLCLLCSSMKNIISKI